MFWNGIRGVLESSATATAWNSVGNISAASLISEILPNDFASTCISSNDIIPSLKTACGHSLCLTWVNWCWVNWCWVNWGWVDWGWVCGGIFGFVTNKNDCVVITILVIAIISSLDDTSSVEHEVVIGCHHSDSSWSVVVELTSHLCDIVSLCKGAKGCGLDSGCCS
jgi:hypothetical protein